MRLFALMVLLAAPLAAAESWVDWLLRVTGITATSRSLRGEPYELEGDVYVANLTTTVRERYARGGGFRSPIFYPNGKSIQAKIGPEGMKEARNLFEKCLELYQGVLAGAGEDGIKLSKDAVSAINRRITRCLLMTGKFAQAVRMYERATEKDPKKKDGNSWESLADCYTERARSLAKGSERTKDLERSSKIYGHLASMLAANQMLNQHYYRLLFKYASNLFELDPG